MVVNLAQIYELSQLYLLGLTQLDRQPYPQEGVNGAAKESMEKMVRSIAAGEDEGSEDILKNFQDWAVSSKLGLGYLIYANKNANTDSFAKK